MSVHSTTTSRTVSPALVGRSAELDRVAAALAAPPAVAVVEGEAGIGKTRLVAELRTHPQVAGRRFLTGWCPRIREPFPLGPVLEGLRGLDRAALRQELSPVAGALRPLLPEAASWLPAAPPRLHDRAAERHRVFRGLVEVLGSMGPLVLVLEDLHWADEQTGEFVGYLLDDPPPELSLVLTFRREEAGAATRATTARSASRMSRTEVVLCPLRVDETGAMAAAILGTEHISDEFAAYLRERTGGLPFAIEELLALLRARGTLVRHGGGWARRTLDELAVPTRIRDSVLERVDGLPAAARSVLEAAAVLQVPVATETLLATARVGAERGLPPLEDLLESGLLTEHGTAVGFRHLLAAQAVYEVLPAPRRLDLHRRAAAALATLAPPPLGQVAHHLRHSGQSGAWVDAAERAADQALELGDDAEAVRLLEDVLRNATLEAARRGRLAVKLGRAAHETGFPPSVPGLLSAAVDQVPAGVVRGELLLWSAMLLEGTGGDFHDVRALLIEAVGNLDERPDLQAWAMAGLGIPTVHGIPLAEHQQWLRRTLATLETVDDPVLETMVLAKVAMVMVGIGDAGWRGLADRIVADTGGLPRQRGEVNAYQSVGVEACYVGHYAAAARLLPAAVEGAATCAGPRLQLRSRSAVALLDYLQGRWEGLEARARAIVDGLPDHAAGRRQAEVVVACLVLAHGQLDDAQERLTDLLHRLSETSTLDLVPVPAAALLRLAVARGDPGDESDVVRRALRAVESLSLWVPAVRALPAMTHAMLEAGEPAEARVLVDRYRRELDGLDAPLAAPALLHAQGFLARAGGRWARAAERFTGAGDRYQRAGCPYEAAQAREHAGAALLAGGDVLRGGGMVHAALEAYAQLGATWDHARATSVARQHGVPVRARHRGGRKGYGIELSPRELEVAELAALGRTNKDIAAELFLSPSTVKKHVAAAIKKLGLKSRLGLAHHFGSKSQGP